MANKNIDDKRAIPLGGILRCLFHEMHLEADVAVRTVDEGFKGYLLLP